ncbi:Oidioi.mRNA.OKI2018_I69.PAR.g13195.t1.cds [Oikopleura dioica]|uniref:Oidioi.mRNA.OKI2018_I69.PAR.g13195.t1.cds n=1 Tax=Oikopleura dioica TaxID=34765 RepID=A0ABN7S3J6_OIKDI|nr:Oidioi.mRNA.OKI2018_I69.PAR.g13195.t1.cds [Oikopleura dioica]
MKPANWNFNKEEKLYSVEFLLPEEIDSTTIRSKVEANSMKLVYDHQSTDENEFQRRKSHRTWTQTIDIPKNLNPLDTSVTCKNGACLAQIGLMKRFKTVKTIQMP